MARLIVLFLVPAASLLAAEPPVPGRQVGLTFVAPNDATQRLNYLLFLPKGYGDEAGRKWPLMIFLHGGGQCGDDLQLLKAHGPPKLVEERPDDFPFIVASPQSPDNEVPHVDRWETYVLKNFLTHLEGEFAVDADRIYLTGLSNGGFGTFRWAAREPGRFAAIVPICGGGWPHYAKQIKDIPTWIFHGDMDPVVPLRYSQEMAEALRERGGNPKVTLYEGVGHDSWTRTYNDPELYKWMLSQKLSDRPPADKK
ncbi:MAG: alpha/beta hydrolase-fold protein [Planctomycetaceae bacterium]